MKKISKKNGQASMTYTVRPAHIDINRVIGDHKYMRRADPEYYIKTRDNITFVYC